MVKLWYFINSNLISGIILLLLSILVSIIFIDSIRKRKRKKLILYILIKELNCYSTPCNTSKYKSFQCNVNNGFIINILFSSILNYKKDIYLIHHLHQLFNWIENFNNANNYANKALIEKKDEWFDFFSKGRDELFIGIVKEKDKILDLLKNKYKI